MLLKIYLYSLFLPQDLPFNNSITKNMGDYILLHLNNYLIIHCGV